jgi:hypothetical protein
LSPSLIERWKGTIWQLQDGAISIGASGGTPNAVACPTAAICTAVGNFT